MKSPCRLLVAGLIWIGAFGCAGHSPDAAFQKPLPAAWKNAAGFPVAAPSKDLARWWRKFEDPVLTRLISDALQNNPDVATASARIRESRARRDIAASSLFPLVTGSVSDRSGVVKTDGMPRVGQTLYSAGLDASWEADLYGKHRSQVEAATAGIGASEENLHSVKASLSAQIANAYTRLRAYENGLEILQGIVKTREETSRLATWRRQSGEADSLEASQALSSLEQARAQVPALQQAIVQTRNLIARLGGRQPGELDGALATGRGRIPQPENSLAVGIPADTIRQRPDVRLAGYQVAAAFANMRSAQVERFPSLALSGSLGLETAGVGKFFDPRTASAGVIAGLTGPIFDAGRIRANIEAQDALAEQAVQNYRSSVLTALSDVEDSLVACRRSSERLASLEKATAAAREADLLARQRYQAGEIDFLAVLDSQRNLLNLEDSLLNTRADRTISYISLYQALGGGWSPSS